MIETETFNPYDHLDLSRFDNNGQFFKYLLLNLVKGGATTGIMAQDLGLSLVFCLSCNSFRLISNFRCGPPQKRNINLNFQEMMYHICLFLVVLLSYHSLDLFEKNISSLLYPMVVVKL